MNYLISLRFDGSAYHGWQRQNNAVSVQQRVEEAAEALFKEKISVTGCSRTDARVHAECFKCNFKSNKLIPHSNIVSGMNFFLPEDIAVFSSEEVPENFNARFSCRSKEYVYKIFNSPVRNPFYLNRALFYKYPLDAAELDAQAKSFLGTHDFSAFQAAGASSLTTVRTVFNAGVERCGDIVVFKVEADGFLYNMVRIMAGTLLYIAEGKIKSGAIPEIIESRNRIFAGKTQEPQGLYLNKVFY